MKNYINLKINLITFLSFSCFFSQTQNIDCPKNTPIYKDNKCQLIFCEEAEFNDNTCIISNNITKIQWLNNLLQISDICYNFVSIIVDLNNNLLLFYNPYSDKETSDVFKERSFYAYNSKGRPYFYNSTNNGYYSYKKMYYDTIVNGKYEGETINIKIKDNTNYYFSPGKDNGYAEIYDFNTGKNYYEKLPDILGYQYTNSIRYFFLNSPNKDIFIFGYIGYFQFDRSPHFVVQKLKFNTPQISKNDESTYERKMVYNEYVTQASMMSCFETEKKYIECFIMKEKAYNVTIFNNSFEEDIFVKLNTSIIDDEDDVAKTDLFFKGISLKKEIGVFIYYFNYDKTIINVKIQNLIIDQQNENYYLENYLSFAEKIEIQKSEIDQYYNLEDLIKINDYKFTHTAFSKSKEILFIFIYELCDNDKNIIVRGYDIYTSLKNLNLRNNLRNILFNGFLGVTFSAHKSSEAATNSYIHFALFNYINSTDPESVKDLFKTYSSYELQLNNYTNSDFIENNIFGHFLSNIKIINISDINSEKGMQIISKKANKIIKNGEFLEIDDSLIIKRFNENSGVNFGNYFIEFAGVMKEPSTFEEANSFNDEIYFFGNNDTNLNEMDKFYIQNNFTGKHAFFNFSIESCYNTCSECNSILGNEINHHCSTCSESYPYSIDNGEKCLKTCQEINLYEYNGKCYQHCSDIFIFSDEDSKICYKDCKENINQNKTTTFNGICVEKCPEGYEINDESKICFLKKDNDDDNNNNCPKYYYVSYSGEKICISDGECRNNYLYIFFDKECRNKLVTYNESFYENCPFNTCINLYNSSINNCINKTEDIIEIGDYCLEKNDQTDKIFKGNHGNISQYIINEDIAITFYSSETNNTLNIDQTATFINLDDCKNDINDYYNLDENSKLSVVILDINKRKVNSTINECEYVIYLENGTLVDVENICENKSILMFSYISDKEIGKYNMITEFNNKFKYNLYNKDDDFYHDYCKPAYYNGNDLTLKDRINDFYLKNISLCNSGCEYYGTNFETNRTTCKCNKKYYYENNEEIIYNEKSPNFINYKIFGCYESITKIDGFFKNNIGLYITLTFLVISCINMGICVILSKGRIENILFNNLKNEKDTKNDNLNVFDSNKKNFESNKINLIDNNSDKKDNNINNPPPRVQTNKEENTKKEIEIYRIENKIINENENKGVKINKNGNYPEKKWRCIKNVLDKQKYYKEYFDKLNKNQNSDEKSQNDVKSNRELSSVRDLQDRKLMSMNFNLKDEEYYLNKNNFSLNHLIIRNDNISSLYYDFLPYSQALRLDKRSFCTFFYNVLLKKIYIIQLLAFRNEFQLIEISLNIFILSILINLFFNAFLYSDDVVSEKYHNDGKLKYETAIKLSFISNIITYILMKFIHMIINYEGYFSLVKKEIKEKEELNRAVAKGIKYMKINIIIFDLINLIIDLIILYYLSLFCAVYPKTQISLLKNFGVGLVEYIIVFVIIIFVITCLRIIGLKCENRELYETSKYMQKFL